MRRIITINEKQLIKIVLVEKHKIKDIIGYQKNNDEFEIDIKKLKRYINNGAEFSSRAFSLMYKMLARLMLKHKKNHVKYEA